MTTSRDYDSLWSEPWQRVQQLGPLTHSRYRLIERELADHLKAGAQLLDVGCGNGQLMGRLLRRQPGLVVQGLESSRQAVATAPPQLASRIVLGDIFTELPRLAERQYDIVVSSEVLEHLADPAEALRLIYQVLRPGGVAVLTVPAGQRWWSSQDVYAGHVQRFEPAQFQSLIEQAGFRPLRVRCWGVACALAYDRMVSLIGPQRVTEAGRLSGSRWLSALLVNLFKLEDAVSTPYGIQLIAAARKP